MSKLSRRSFMKTTAAGLAAVSVPFTARSYGEIVGSNEAVRVGVIGFNGRGKSHMHGVNEEAKKGGMKLSGLCDVDEKVLGAQMKNHDEKAVLGVTDMRKLFDSKTIDAVSIATPNHWHSLAAIWAIQAGKDVYCEKPVSHNVSEGRRLVEFARKYNKIVQCGTQSRSSRQGIAQGVEYVRSGKLGKILIARGLCYKRRPSISGDRGKATVPFNIPAGLDFDLWCGPAEKLPIMRKDLHYDWHWVWNTGNGDLGNQGIHEMDVARWFLGEQELSSKVLTVGGRLGYIDDGETPNTMIVHHTFKTAPLLFEVRGLPDKPYPKGVKDKMDNFKGVGVGIVIECENGSVTIPSYSKAIVKDKEGKEVITFADKGADGTDAHFANWHKAIRSRKREDLHAEIEEGHLSSALCHTGNISIRLGAAADPDAIAAAVKEDAQFAEAFERVKHHLELNKVDISKEKLTLGVPLTMDPKTEKFIGNADADKMLTRNYRAPYIVPDKV